MSDHCIAILAVSAFPLLLLWWWWVDLCS